MARPDRDLLLAWRGGDEAAGARLIERNAGLLVGFFRNKAADAVDDLVQQTFLRCIEGRDRVEDPDKFRSYLLTIAHRELIAFFRRQGREQRHFDVEATSAWDLDPRPSTIVAELEEQRLLAEALRRIPVVHQVALELFYWQDLTAAEVARVLELPEGTVRSRLRRGRELVLAVIQELSSSELASRTSIDDIEQWARSLRDTPG